MIYMERKINNRDINKTAEFNNNQLFFVQRWLEILNVNTQSKYANKYLNSHQALKELIYVCEGMLNGDIKANDYHLKIVVEEVREVIMKDWLFEETETPYYNAILPRINGLSKANQRAKIYSIVYQLKYIVNEIKDTYLTNLVGEIKRNLLLDCNNYSGYERIDFLIGSLISELIAMGWSTHRLYELMKEDFLSYQDQAKDRWDFLFDVILSNENEYICLFSFQDTPSTRNKELMSRMDIDIIQGADVVNTYLNGKLKSHVKKKEMFIRVMAQSYDNHSAYDFAWLEIERKLDTLQFYGYYMLKVKKTAIIIDTNKESFNRNTVGSWADQQKKHPAPVRMLEVMNAQLQNHKHEKINNKINNVLQFSRMSEESPSSQKAFINLWIALESFVQTNESEGGFERVKNNISTAASHNYLYTLIRTLMEDFGRCNVEWQHTEQNGNKKVKKEYQFLECLLDEENGSRLIEKSYEHNILLGYRCEQLRSTLSNGKEASKLIKSHMINVQRHLQRFYRIRNAIVHTGETQYNTNLFVKHIREYVEFTVSVVLYRIGNHQIEDLEEILAMMRDSVDMTIELLNSLGQNHTLDDSEYQNILLNGVF